MLDVSPLRKEEHFFDCLSLARAYVGRSEQALRSKTAAGRALSLGAGLLLLHALGEAGVDFGERLRPEIGPHGKPYLPGLRGVDFNLSHAGELALCALWKAEGDERFTVGVDVERCDLSREAIARRFFSGSECAEIEASSDPCAAFYRFWTLRESYVKACGRGMSLPFSSFSFARLPCLCALEDGKRAEASFAEYTLTVRESAYAAALCVLHPGFEAPVLPASAENADHILRGFAR